MKKNENVFTVENAAVENKSYAPYLNECGFMHNGDGLIFVSVKNVRIDFVNKSVTTVLVDNEGVEYTREGSYDLFRSSENYESNVPIPRRCYGLHELLHKARWGQLCECRFILVPENEESREKGYLCVWVFENGDAREIPVPIHVIEWNSEGGWHLVEGTLPEKFWESREMAFGFNTYKITDTDGEVFEEDGIHKRLCVTPEQIEILKELKEAFKKATDAGIGFVFDKANDRALNAYNALNIRRFDYDPHSFEGGDVVYVENAILYTTNIDFRSYYSDDPDVGFVMEPTAYQHKQWLKQNPENK